MLACRLASRLAANAPSRYGAQRQSVVSAQQDTTLTPTSALVAAFAEPANSVLAASNSVLAACKKHPLLAAVFCATLKDSSCDVATQRTMNPEGAPWDWRRTAIFATFGATFVGAWQYWLFSVVVPRVIPMSAGFAAAPLRQKLTDTVGLRSIALFVAVENLFNQPFGHFPTLYAIKYRLTHGTASLAVSAAAGVSEARRNFFDDNVNSCAVWVPATLINGLFVPVWARVPFMNLCGCGWTCFMSYTKGAPDADADPISEIPAPLVGRRPAFS